MKTISQNVILLFFVCGVFGAETDEEKTVSVMEGDSVTLNPNLTDINKYRDIVWRFGSELIADIAGDGKISYKDGSNGRFRDRLQLDSKTASLTITNIKIKHSGLYKLEATSTSIGTKYKTERVAVYESPSVIDAGKAELKSVSVTEEDSVTLQTDVTETHGDELIVWRFGVEGKLIAKCDIEAKNSPLYYVDTDERFRDRLKLDEKTGSLTITNTRNTDSGLYSVKIISNSKQTLYRFSVTVSEPGLSSGAVAGIVIGVLLLVLAVAAAAAVGVIYYRRKISELESQKLKKVSVKEGDDVTLNTDVTEIQSDDLIEWRSGDGGPLIAALRGGNIEIYDTGLGERFRDRLELDKKTGSLTIKNTRNTDTGLYQLMIRQDSKIKYQMFNVSVFENTLSVFEGDPVTLKTDAELQSDDVIEWSFGDKEHLIAAIRGGNISKYDEDTVGRFRGRLKLDEKTGSLTITNTEMKHTGVYQLLIKSNSGDSYKTFRVTVRERNISVEDGKNLNLSPETEIQKDDQIQWRFGDQDILIAELRGGSGETHDDGVPDGIFRGRLKLDEKTGSLIITDITAEQSGYYKLQIIRSRGTTNKRFVVTVYPRNILVREGELEGKSITLETNTEIQKDDQIQWRFGDKDILLAEVRGGTGETHDDNGRFRNRLTLDEKTGSLTIARIRKEHTGDYKLQIRSSRGTTNKRFKVVVECSTYTYKRVLDGGNVTLSSDTCIVKGEVKWFLNGMILATGMDGDSNETSYCDDGRFIDRLELDHETGSLTIKNTRASDSGDYHLKVPKLGIERKFRVTVNERNKSVKEGNNVILNPETEIQKDDQIQWMFENILIAELREGSRGKTHDDGVPDGIFRGRLKLDEKTGSLIITELRPVHAGVYKLQISSSRGTSDKTFCVTVYSNRVNDSAAVQMPPVNEEDPDVGNEQEGMSLLVR